VPTSVIVENALAERKRTETASGLPYRFAAGARHVSVLGRLWPCYFRPILTWTSLLYESRREEHSPMQNCLLSLLYLGVLCRLVFVVAESEIYVQEKQSNFRHFPVSSLQKLIKPLTLAQKHKHPGSLFFY
jgi:hypothetical protein